MTPRFFVDADLTPGTQLPLPGDVAHHATRVLRLHDGDAVVLFNGRGGECHGTLKVGTVHLERHDPIEREPPLAVTLVQAWIATEKLDWVVEKSVELGVARIVMTPAVRSVVQLSDARRAARLARLAQLARAACAQCGRNRVPAIEAVESFEAALRVRGADAGWLLTPHAERAFAGDGTAALALAIGPEGGFTDDEQTHALAAGWSVGSLGPRILRTETAGLAALAAVQARAGDLR